MAGGALSVEEALARMLSDASPLGVEEVAIEAAFGRILAAPLAARLTQPPFPASAMDGYAVRRADLARPSARLRVLGQAAAGHPFAGAVGAGEAVRIFTGAPVPEGADAILIQEEADRDGDHVTARVTTTDLGYVRATGFDFEAGAVLLEAGRRLGPRELALAAAMGHGRVAVWRRPVVAVLSTGDELVPPGGEPGAGQIVASNHLAVGALAALAGGEAIQLGIARDTAESIESHLERARAADVLVTIGGASVGDHDLVAPVLTRSGMDLAFWKIAMRPGKPLMFGRLDRLRVLGLPGNPVSAIVCARVFLVPLVRRLAGWPEPTRSGDTAVLAVDVEANGPRQHYMRATLFSAADGRAQAQPVRSQDSALLSPLAAADCLLVRPPNAPLAPAGSTVPILRLDF